MPGDDQVNAAQYDSLQPIQGPWPRPHHSEFQPEEVKLIPVEG